MALSLFIDSSLFAQKNPANENQLKKQANSFFEDENYAKAYLQYSQLLSLYPQDPNYNYRFGACMLFSQSDKKKAIDYIETAVKQPNVDDLAYYYLGRAYHLNYRFDDAIKAFQHFKQNASSSDLKKHPVDRLIEMCNNGKQLLGSLHDLDVLRKKELDMADYYQAYDLSLNGGNLLAEPDDFKSKIDKKKGFNPIIYLSADKTQLFFSSYGDDDKNGKDIYVAYHMPNGAWGKPNNIGPVINTQYDEDYPFYDAPTHTLYFCSTGHNSMGGYDIFRSTYDEATRTWSTPVNMDFPINSPGDDILFIADTLNETAFFSSNRTSPDGKLAVYKIAIQPHAPDFLVIKGTTYNDAGSTLAASRITVKNFQTNEVVGIFNTTADNGSYVMNLPNGGHFIYTVETANHKTQSESVTLPMQEDLTPFQQQITYEPSTDRLIIKNNGSASDSNYLASLDMIQKNAAMDVNTDTTAPKKYTPATFNNPTNPPLATNTPSQNNPANNPPDTASTAEPDSNDIAIDTTSKKGVSSNDIEAIAKNDAVQKQNEAQAEKDEANRDIEYAANRLTESEQLNRRANALTAMADTLKDPKQKSDTLAKADQLKQKANEDSKKAMEAFQLASQQEIDATVKQKEADHATRYAASLDSAMHAPGKEKAIKKLQAQRDSIEKQDEANPPTTPTAGDLMRLQAQNTKQDSVEVVKHDNDLQKEADRLQQEADDYVAQAQKTDNNDEKLALLAQARDLTNSKKEKENEIKDNQKTLQQLHEQYNNLIVEARQIDSTTKSNPQSQQLTGTDASNLKEDIKNFTPSQNTPTATTADTSHHTQPVVNNNHSPVTADTTHKTQPVNPVAVNNPQTNPTLNNPAPTKDTTASQPAQNNPIAVNNPLPTKDTTHAAQVTNPTVAVNNPQTNPSQNNPPVTSAVNSSINYSSDQATQATKNATTFYNTSNTLSAQAADVRNQAKQATDPQQVQALSHKADSLDDASQEQRVIGSIYVNTADSAQYKSNSAQLNAWEGAMNNNNSDSVQVSQTLLLDAKGYYEQGLKEKQKADATTNQSVKQSYLDNAKQDFETAISKQQHAHDILLTANPGLKNITAPAIADTTHATPVTNPVAINNPQTNPVQNNPAPNKDTTHATQPNNPVAVNNPQTNPIQNNHTPTNDTTNTTQPITNPVAVNNPQNNPVPAKDTSHATEPTTNPVAVNNPQNPTQNNQAPTKDTSHTTQPANNPVAVNNPQKNPVPTKDTNRTAQPTTNPVAINNPQTNPVQNNPSPTKDTAHTTKPLAVNNPNQNNKGLNSANHSQNKPSKEDIDKGLVNFPQQYQHALQAEDITEAQESPYTETHPIPINPPLPEGLVFKVQIGAFKKPIKQSAFRGLQPITGETTTRGFTRYTAGLFKELPKANAAKNKVHRIGYRDAFVVAFYNGKRISLKEAETLLNGGSLPNNTQVPNPVAVNNPTQPSNTNNPQNGETNPVPVNNNVPVQNNGVANSIPVNDVKGLFFTVQVGAFKTPVTADKLYNLSPLFSKSGTNGNIRYNCGMYSDLNKAIAAKQSIVSKTPIKDAFVTAYYNGERITLAKAAELLGNKSASLPSNSELDRTPNANNTNTAAQEPATTDDNPLSHIKFDTTAFPEGNIYAVILADFTGQLSAEDGNKVLQVAIQHGITIHTSKEGRVIYSVGKFREYKQADSLQALITSVLPEATVMEFINNQPMSYSGGAGRTPLKGKSRPASGIDKASSNNAHAGNTETAPSNNNAPSTFQPTPATINNTNGSNTAAGKVVFCVQVGSYSGQMPVNVTNNLIKIANQGITTHQEANGVSSYTIGSYNNYQSAKLLKDELVQAGFPGCFVVAYSGSKKVSLQEAQSILNK